MKIKFTTLARVNTTEKDYIGIRNTRGECIDDVERHLWDMTIQNPGFTWSCGKTIAELVRE